MAYKKKIYVSFDADDLIYYNMLKAWCSGETQEFAHYSPNNSSQKSLETVGKVVEEKLRFANCFIVLVSDHTVSLGVQMSSEIEKAIKLDKPIVVVNLNGKRSIDKDLCPLRLRSRMVLHVSFNAKIIQKAIESWPSYYEQNRQNGSGAHFFKPEVYNKLGI